MGETSVEFHDGSGYLLYMDVFHQLHCLNYLRKKLEPWKSSYPSIPSDENFPEAYHTGKTLYRLPPLSISYKSYRYERILKFPISLSRTTYGNGQS